MCVALLLWNLQRFGRRELAKGGNPVGNLTMKDAGKIQCIMGLRVGLNDRLFVSILTMFHLLCSK